MSWERVIRTLKAFSVTLLVCGLTSCEMWPEGEIRPGRPDQLLFEKAMSALERKRFAVANLTLQTLVNTYPDSNYATKARAALEDPQVSECGEPFNSCPGCQDRARDENRPTTHN
jgi:hypothetical protein